MLKQLTLAALAGALLPACIISTSDDSTTSGAESSSSGGSTGSTSSTDPTSGTTQSETTDGTTSDTPTTDTPTTDDTTSAGTVTMGSTTDTTEGTTSENTTGQGDYGQCGWYAEEKYYTCVVDGAVASLEDPDMISPIKCPDGLKEGGKCDEEMGPVKGVGCCTPEGVLFYCDSAESNSIFKQECGL